MNPRFTRLHIKLKIGPIQFYSVISLTQRLGGLTSRLKNGNHIILWDLENCTQSEALRALNHVQGVYGLGQIYLLSDKPNSYGAVCFTEVKYIEMLKILANTEYVDTGFINYTAQRGEATLRMTKKYDRPIERKLDCVLRSQHHTDRVKKNLHIVEYETGLVKEGLVLNAEI